MLLLGARHGECCVHALAPTHSLGSDHLHHKHRNLPATQELRSFPPPGLWAPRWALPAARLGCWRVMLPSCTPAHTHGLPCLRPTKGPSSPPLKLQHFSTAHPRLLVLTVPPLFPHWPRADSDTQSRCPTQASVHKGPTHLLHQIPGVLAVSQFSGKGRALRGHRTGGGQGLEGAEMV